jgi:hypothetical protein
MYGMTLNSVSLRNFGKRWMLLYAHMKAVMNCCLGLTFWRPSLAGICGGTKLAFSPMCSPYVSFVAYSGMEIQLPLFVDGARTAKEFATSSTEGVKARLRTPGKRGKLGGQLSWLK